MLSVGIALDDAKIDDKTDSVVLGDAELTGRVTVTMPESVLPIRDDVGALAMVVAALEMLASDKTQLANEPADVAQRTRLANDRFRVTRRTTYSDPVPVKGIDIWTARTRIAAGPLIEALGLAGKIEHNQARDTDDYLLYAHNSSSHEWHGMKVEVAFSRRPSAESGEYGEYMLDGIFLMP